MQKLSDVSGHHHAPQQPGISTARSLGTTLSNVCCPLLNCLAARPVRLRPELLRSHHGLSHTCVPTPVVPPCAFELPIAGCAPVMNGGGARCKCRGQGVRCRLGRPRGVGVVWSSQGTERPALGVWTPRDRLSGPEARARPRSKMETLLPPPPLQLQRVRLENNYTMSRPMGL